MTSTVERLRKEGWKSFEVTDTEKRQRSCWVSPEGKWYNVEYGCHPIFAKYVIEEKYPDYKQETDHESEIMLRKIGWIFIHHDIASGTIVHLKKMTQKQYEVLKEFFGDEMLFRGWTIEALWSHHRGD